MINENQEAQETVLSKDDQISEGKERLLSQEDVNRIAAKARAEGHEKGRQEASRSMGGMMSVDQIENLVAKKAQEHIENLRMQHESQSQKAQAEKIASEFISKMSDGLGKYEDFEDAIKMVNFGEHTELIHLTKDLPNTADIWYEISANKPGKLAELDYLAKKSPSLARKAIEKLSKSIEVNSSAKDAEELREPLGQVKASAITNANSSTPSPSMFRGASFLKG